MEVFSGYRQGRAGVAEFVRGRKVVLLTGAASYEACGGAEFLSEPLSGAAEVLHIRVTSANPQLADVRAKAALAKGRGEVILALGGGSVIDTAKVVNMEALLAAPFFAIPTTAGTGAEATYYGVVYEGEVKQSLGVPELLACKVALVPEFTCSMNAWQTACTGFDALAQCVESLWSRDATAKSREFAERGLSAWRSLPRAISAPKDLAAREAMLNAAFDSGRAINISRTTAAHAYSYILTSRYGAPHGLAVALVFPFVARHNAEATAKLSADARDFCGNIKDFIKEIGLPDFDEWIAENGLDAEKVKQDVEDAVNRPRLANNPVKIERLFE